MNEDKAKAVVILVGLGVVVYLGYEAYSEGKSLFQWIKDQFSGAASALTAPIAAAVNQQGAALQSAQDTADYLAPEGTEANSANAIAGSLYVGTQAGG